MVRNKKKKDKNMTQSYEQKKTNCCDETGEYGELGQTDNDSPFICLWVYLLMEP